VAALDPGIVVRRRSLHAVPVAGAAVITGVFVEVDPAAVTRTVDSISERNRAAEARHRYPQCHPDHFTQRASGGGLPY
jgi:hypothetical protein